MRSAFLAVPLLVACSHAAPQPGAPAEAPVFSTTVTGSGRPVIFIPDLQAPGEVWDTTLTHLGGKVEAHVVEIAGFAGNPPAKGPLMARLRDGLAGYIRERHLKDPILVGHMFGGSVAWWLAMTEPEHIGGVVAIDAPPSMSEGEAEQTAEAVEVRRQLAEADGAKFNLMVTRRLCSMMADQELAKRIAEKAVRSSPPVVAEAFYDMMTLDLRTQIAGIRAPVLVVRTTGNIPAEAREDSKAAYEKQLAPIPRHELVVVEGSKHYVMFDAPEKFFAALDSFLAANQR